MKHSQYTPEYIAKTIAAVEFKITQRRHQLRILEARLARLKKAQAALSTLQHTPPHSGDLSRSKAETRTPTRGARYFHAEGQTATLVRFLYGKTGGTAVLEAAKHTGVPTLRTRNAFERLCDNGLMRRRGNKYSLTQKGIAAWEESPLFGMGRQPESVS